MFEAVRKGPGVSRASILRSAWQDPAARMLSVDLLATLIAILLPWSTTGVGIAIALWIVAFGFTVEPRSLLRSLTRPACALPIAFFVLALLGTLWSDASWQERAHAIGPLAKFLVLPLLIYHFERSTRGSWVFIAFLVSCTILMLATWAVAFDPDLSLKRYLSRGPYRVDPGIVVKNYIDQGQEFSLCAVALAYPVVTSLREARIGRALMLAAVAVSLVVNMIFVVISRTALVTMPVMLAVFALLHLRWRVAIAALGCVALLSVVLWYASPHLRTTVGKFFIDYRETFERSNESGMGSRLIYWQKALRFFATAPAIGHGTGSTQGLYERAAVGETGANAIVVRNPHNQTLNVVVQWGAVGVIVLWAMWLTHLLLFRGEGIVSWIGLLVVVQNILTSLLNSHLFDFNEGWMYVLGVGIAGGMTLAKRASPHQKAPGARSGHR